jgi:tetratricopeptide (TPR) repeat protein
MYEALGGQLASSPGALQPPLNQFNPRVSPGLADIIQKCLKPDPRERYRDASVLANDLRRHLNHLPLRGVRNRSLGERWRKWRRRQPVSLFRGLVVLTLAGSALFAAGSVGLSYRRRIRDIDHALAQGRSMLHRRHFTEAGDAFRRGLTFTEHLPGVTRKQDLLAHELARATRGSKLEELHQLAELIRFRYCLTLPPPEEARSLIQLGRTIWNGRSKLIAPLAGEAAAGIDDRTRTDLLDLLVLWANLRVSTASTAEALLAYQEALGVLTQAKALLGSSPSLERGRRAFALTLGQESATSNAGISARSAWEHFDLGKSYLRTGDTERARHEFRAGLELRPQDFWLNFYDGLCAFRLKRFDESVNAFRVSIALQPASAHCRYNRGLAHQSLGRLDDALADYGRALQLDERFTDAALNRGMILLRLGRHDEARESLERAMRSASSREVRGVIYYGLALVDRAAGHRESCAVNVQAALDLGNPDAAELARRLHR